MKTEHTAQDLRLTWNRSGWIPLSDVDHHGTHYEYWAHDGALRVLSYPSNAKPEDVQEGGYGIQMWPMVEATLDLLEALQDAVAWWHNAPRHFQQAEPAWVAKTRAAIAKATPQSDPHWDPDSNDFECRTDSCDICETPCPDRATETPNQE